jgi:hypothetical protein
MPRVRPARLVPPSLHPLGSSLKKEALGAKLKGRLRLLVRKSRKSRRSLKAVARCHDRHLVFVKEHYQSIPATPEPSRSVWVD